MNYNLSIFWPTPPGPISAQAMIDAWRDVGVHRTVPAFAEVLDFIEKGLPMQVYAYAFTDVQTPLELNGASTYVEAVTRSGPVDAPVLIVSDGMAACLVITCAQVEGATPLNELNIVSRTNLANAVRGSVSEVVSQLAILQQL